jgi:subtilisin family serine protease
MTVRAPHRRRVRPGHLVVLAVAAAGIAFATPAAAALPAQGSIVNAGGADAIPGSYIVVLKNTPSLRSAGVSATARTLVERRGGRLGYVYQSALTGFSATLTETAARQFAADPTVALVEQNHRVRVADTQTNPPSWGLDRIDQRDLPLDKSYTSSTTASNVHAYIIDTGILTTHVAFAGRAVSGRDTVDNDNDATDCHGHGTHVAGTVGSGLYGVAKGVSLVAVRVLDCQGSGSDAGVVAGIDWVTANAIKPAVANMSLGGGASPTLDAAVLKSINAGITYGIAAGNGDIFGTPQDACGTSPARVPAAITVGATQIDDAKASFSNYGTCLDIFAPGVGITSSWGSGNTATNTISGTSMATPHVVGAAALILAANPTFTPAQVRDKMVADATSGKVTSPGTGSPNKLLFVGGGATPPPPPPPPPGKYFENTGDVPIPDVGAAVTSSIAVTGIAGNAPAALKVGVKITHTYIGDLVVDLIAPDGSVYNLHNRAGGSTDNIAQTYSVNASSEVANGTWILRVQDKAAIDVGFIDSFSLQF